MNELTEDQVIVLCALADFGFYTLVGQTDLAYNAKLVIEHKSIMDRATGENMIAIEKFVKERLIKNLTEFIEKNDTDILNKMNTFVKEIARRAMAEREKNAFYKGEIL